VHTVCLNIYTYVIISIYLVETRVLKVFLDDHIQQQTIKKNIYSHQEMKENLFMFTSIARRKKSLYIYSFMK